MRQAWRDTPRVVSNPLPVPSSSSSSNEEGTDFMFAMSFSESYDGESDLSPLSDGNGHTLHPDVLFHRARQQSARGGIGSARDGTVLYHTSRKRPQLVQSLYSFPEPSALMNSESSTSPDSPISGRWPSHSLSSRHGAVSATTHLRRYGPISQSSADYHYRPPTTHSSTDGDEDGEEDEDEDEGEGEGEGENPDFSSNISKPYSARPDPLSYSNRGNYPLHIPSSRVDFESKFKTDHHSSDAKNVQSGHSHSGKTYDTPRRNDFYASTSHRNNQLGAHTYLPPTQNRLPDAKHSKHSRHRSTHDVISHTPRLDCIEQRQHHQPYQHQHQHQQKLGVVPTITTRPRSNTGGSNGCRLSAPRHPLMSKTTATSYVASSTLVPPGLVASADPQNVVTNSFANLKLN